MKEYLLMITAAALICSIAEKLVKNTAVKAMQRLVCGIFLALSVISPWLQIRLDSIGELASDIWFDGQQISQTGENLAADAIRAYIKEETQAYILDKADSMGVSLDVEVTVSGEDIPIPVGVKITGSVSPYCRSILSECIREELGIGTEAQLWMES